MRDLLTVTACTVANDGTVEPTCRTIQLRVDPVATKSTSQTRFERPGQGDARDNSDTETALNFVHDSTEKLNFNCVLEGDETGTVEKKISALKEIAFLYNGSTHEWPVCQLTLGDSLKDFECRLVNLDTSYTLFSCNGEALRARLEMSFLGYATPKEIALLKSHQAPDLTHTVVVKAGDTLPLLCQKIYNDPAHYRLVAHHNRLTNFRELQPGTTLEFPSIR